MASLTGIKIKLVLNLFGTEVFGYFCSVFSSALKLNKRNRRGREEEAEKEGGGEEEG